MISAIDRYNIELYDKSYSDFYTRFSYEVRGKVQILFSLKFLFKNIKSKKILDIGFGTGDMLMRLAEKGADCYGVETVDSAILMLKKISKYPLKLFKADARTLPFEDDYFDLVICSHVIEHIADDKAVLSEIRRVLKGSGIAVIMVPSTGSGRNNLHYREYSPEMLRELIDNWQVLLMRFYGSRLLQLALGFKARLSDRFLKGYQIRKDHQDTPTYGLLRRLYHRIVVTGLLWLSFFDNMIPFFKENPVEICVVLRK